MDGVIALKKTKGMVADAYVPGQTYAAGAVAIKDNKLQRYNGSTWSVITLEDLITEADAEIATMRSALNAIGLDIENGHFVISPVTV